MQSNDIDIAGKSQETAPKATAAQKLTAATKKPSAKPGYVTIMIPKTERETRDVYVAHNFIPYQIKRGVDVDVPEGVLEALELAVGLTWITEEDPVTRRVTLTPQETLAVPFMMRRAAAPRAAA